METVWGIKISDTFINDDVIKINKHSNI